MRYYAIAVILLVSFSCRSVPGALGALKRSALQQLPV